MISINAYALAAFVGVSVALDWLTVEVMEHQVASYLCDRGADVSSDVPLEDFDCQFPMPLFVELGEEHPLGALVTRVTEIWIWDTEELEDEDLLLLRHLPSLKFVWVDDPNITGIGITHLRHCHSLEELRIHNTNIRPSDFWFLRNLPRLRSLTFHVPGDGDTLAGVEDLGQLEDLVIYGLDITEWNWKSLKNLRPLYHLGLVDCRSRDVKIKLDFSIWPRLQSLTLSSCQLTSEEWESVFTNKELIRLVVEDALLFPDQLQGIRRNKSLRGLHFINVRFDSNLEFDLSQLSRLEHVTFDHCVQVDSYLDDLEKLPNLRDLVLIETVVSESAIKDLTLGPQFETLVLTPSEASEAPLSTSSEAHFRSNNPKAEVLRGLGYWRLPIPIAATDDKCSLTDRLYKLIPCWLLLPPLLLRD